jgi:hypothetical protein
MFEIIRIKKQEYKKMAKQNIKNYFKKEKYNK